MDNDKLFEKIESYLKGELSIEEMTAFEDEIKNNPKLAEAVDMHRFEWDVLEILVETDLRDKMMLWDKPISNTPSVNSEVNKPFLNFEKGGLSRRLTYVLSAAVRAIKSWL